MRTPDEPGVSRRVLINSAILAAVVIAALVLFFVFGRGTTPILEAGALPLPSFR